MKLNRARALFLVGTIAAVACTVEDGDDNGDGGAGGDDSGGSSGKGGSAGSAGKGGSAGSSAGTAGSGGTEAGAAGAAGNPGEGGDGGVGPSPGGAPGAGGAAEGGASGDNWGGSGNEGGAGAAPSCDEESTWSVSCEGLNASACEGIQTFLEDQCGMSSVLFKGYVSDSVRSCMIALSDSALCDATNTYSCIQEGLLGSCPDAGVEDDCAEIASSCAEGVINLAECSTYLSGMTEAGRTQVVSCVADGGTCDLWTCIEGLDYPSVE